MDNDRYNNWKVAFKFFSLGVVIIGVGWTAYTYFHDKSAESNNLEEARKKEQNSIVYKHQADLYFDTARAAATIATALDPTAKDVMELATIHMTRSSKPQN